MAKVRISSPLLLLLAAVVLAGGVWLLDVCVLKPYVVSQRDLALLERTAAVESAAGWFLRMEERRLAALGEGLLAMVRPGSPPDANALARQIAPLPELGVVWVCGPSGRIEHLWSRLRGKPDEPAVREAMAQSFARGAQAPPSAADVANMGLLAIGGEAFVLARCGAGPGPQGIYLARRLGGSVLDRMGAAIGAELMLVDTADLPRGRSSDPLGERAVWPMPEQRLGVAWPARDVAGRLLGHFRADLSVAQIHNQAAANRRAVLVILAVSAGAVLLLALAVKVFLTNPMASLLRRLQKVASGELQPEGLTEGLHAEPLQLARKLQAAFDAMSQLSRTDTMTGLANRRHFDASLEQAYHQARRYSHPLSLMVMDIDLFKAVNDTKGHQAGDEVIRSVAGLIRRCCRKVDLPARLGGDEFGVLLPETGAAEAAVVADRIRKAVLAKAICIEGSEIRVTISIGIADLNADRIEGPEDLMALADEALYAAKQLGRNRFVQAQELKKDPWPAGDGEAARVEMLRGKLMGLDTQFKSLFVRVLQEIVQVMERRDPHMADHARKVQRYSVMIARQLGLSEELIKQIELAALLHDIGMLALPDSVALCPGKLNEQQIETMHRHPTIGSRILEGTEFLEQVIPVVHFHHERFDGKGYPEGLSGLGIPPICRIVAVADAFDAMTSRRAFRSAMTPEQAVAELRKSAGAQFDPEMVDAFASAAQKLGPKLTGITLSASLHAPDEAQSDTHAETAGAAP